ncbi:MAG: putative alpha/beta-fold hydrolase [Alteromonadaceae bacterium]|jgi:predicted alpha/beta-fold hydrolase
MRNPHLQTILPRFFSRPNDFEPINETFELPDGDFVQLSWSEKPQANNSKPIVVIFHGLEGSIDSFYAKGMINAIKNNNWIGVLMHFRGCGSLINRHSRAYHSGETEDARCFIQSLHQQYPNSPLSAIGFSLGGNMLAKYLGEQGKNSLLDAAVVISAPLSLSPCAKRIGRRFSRVYQKYLLDMLKQTMTAKLKHLKGQFELNITASDIAGLKTLKDFDEMITGPLHGFSSAEDYYQKASGLPFLKAITTPTLIIHAADDPFMSHHVVPDAKDLSPAISYELSKHGGHVGFIYGKHPLRPQFWLEQRAPEFINTIWRAS